MFEKYQTQSIINFTYNHVDNLLVRAVFALECTHGIQDTKRT